MCLKYPKVQKKKKKRIKHPKSILHEQDGTCYLCALNGNFRRYPYTEEHHIFGGSNRKHSEETGLKVYLCPDHHTMAPYAVHRCQDTMDLLHRIGQTEYEKTHTRQQFMRIFEKNYL